MAVAAHPTLTISLDEDPDDQVDHLRLIPSETPDGDASSPYPEPDHAAPDHPAPDHAVITEAAAVWNARRDHDKDTAQTDAGRTPQRLRSSTSFALDPQSQTEPQLVSSAELLRSEPLLTSQDSGQAQGIAHRSLDRKQARVEPEADRTVMALARQVAGLQAQRDHALDRLDQAERELAELRSRQLQADLSVRRQLRAIKQLVTTGGTGARAASGPSTVQTATPHELQQLEKILTLLRNRRSSGSEAVADSTAPRDTRPAPTAETHVPGSEVRSTTDPTPSPSRTARRGDAHAGTTSRDARSDGTMGRPPWTPAGDTDDTLTLQALLDPQNNPMPLLIDTPFHDAEPMPRAVRRKATRSSTRRARRKTRR